MKRIVVILELMMPFMRRVTLPRAPCSRQHRHHVGHITQMCTLACDVFQRIPTKRYLSWGLLPDLRFRWYHD